jgi:hypothetical protein
MGLHNFLFEIHSKKTKFRQQSQQTSSGSGTEGAITVNTFPLDA